MRAMIMRVHRVAPTFVSWQQLAEIGNYASLLRASSVETVFIPVIILQRDVRFICQRPVQTPAPSCVELCGNLGDDV
jgi:hypothetical protein